MSVQIQVSPRLQYTVDLYRVNTGLFRRVTELCDVKNIDFRPMDTGNSFRFLTGHITLYRHSLAATLGLEVKFAWTELFDLGARPMDPSAYPPMTELLEAFNNVSDPMMRRLEEITDKELDGPPSFTVQVPGAVNTVGGMVSFGAIHESYHIGQMAYLVRLLGGERLIR